MLSNLKFRSKKGMSLAVSLTICMFLIMITGGITTVALLQQNETGSDMNSRQAYISAKSGLDTFQDALKNSAITGLPETSGSSTYYVLYYDEDGNLIPKEVDSEDRARFWTKKLGESYSIVGGAGTYFKVINKDNKYKVTALNVTGKYNANVSMNRGDLSFDAVIMNKYIFKIKDSTEETINIPTIPSAATMTLPIPTGATERGTLPPPPPPVEPGDIVAGGVNGQFLMIGQQSCFNEAMGQGGAVSSGVLLKQYFKSGDNSNLFIAYAPSVENRDLAYTYFPVVYDRCVKIETNADRTTVNVIDEGIYFLGEGQGYKDVDQFYATYNGDVNHTLGKVSYITQNEAYEMNLNCKFLCIKNNFVSVGKDSRVTYCGKEKRGYVVAYLPNEVTFFRLNGDSRGDEAIISKFSVQPGYYKLTDGSEICNSNSWKTPLTNNDPEYQHYVDFNKYDTIMSYYAEIDGVKGEIHSGCHESEIANNVHIVNNSGHFNTGENPSTGFTKSTTFTYADRSNQSIFLAPNTGVSETGNYHWYCGRSFNFQWFRTYDFTINTDCNVEISAPTIVLTIGPAAYREDGSKVQNISNTISGQKSATLTLHGKNGTGAPGNLTVMCPFNVKYIDSNGQERTYPVKAGVYTNVPLRGLNLLSEAGEEYFRFNFIAYELGNANQIVKPEVRSTRSSSAGGSVAAQAVSVQTNRIANLFSKFAQKLAISPLVAEPIKDNAAHEHTLSSMVDDIIPVDEGIKKLYYYDNNIDRNPNIHTLIVNSTSKTIQKGIARDVYKDYIVFEKGTYKIPSHGEEKIDLYDIKTFIERSEDTGSNFKLKEVVRDKVEIINQYY